MPKTLILLRHAQAEDANRPIQDFDRHLTDKGEIDACRIGGFLREAGYIPQKIYASDAMRTQQTATFVAEQLRLSTSLISHHHELYILNLGDFIQFIQEADPACQTVMIVGHNPIISFMAEYLTNANVFLEPASAVVLELAVEAWQDVQKNSARLLLHKVV